MDENKKDDVVCGHDRISDNGDFYKRSRSAESGSETKVTYTLKKGTLTIKGKGAMPTKMKIRRNKKIKKVIIKKCVTSVSY